MRTDSIILRRAVVICALFNPHSEEITRHHSLSAMDKTIRILDANLNRCREGLRVVEDVVRFVLDDADLASQIKTMRHEVTSLVRQLSLGESELLSARDSEGDVGADIDCASEDLRVDLSQIATANIRRSQEATRVLEELSKLYNTSIASRFKNLRFRLYGLEKEILPKLIEHKTRGRQT
jgi:thiamine-phosphate pyrophosphorylase